MWNVVVCDGDESERELLIGFVRRYSGEQRREASAWGVADWSELYDTLRHGEPDIIVIAQNGVTGLDTITSAHLPPGKFIWFSDLDFAVQAYRLCVAWFGKKPVTYQKMERALARCMEIV